MQQYYWTLVTLRVDHAREGYGKGRKPKTCMWLLCTFYRNEYNNLKLAKATMGRGLGSSEEDW
jgi:hypothetical protein